MRLSLSWTSAKNWLSVTASVFIGGALGFVETNLADAVSGSWPWKRVLAGAVIAGGIAVWHLAQVPKDKPALGAPETPKDGN